MPRTPPEPGGPITPDKLRWIADYLDLADMAATQLAIVTEQPNPQFGTEVQDDLRRWANEMENDGPLPRQ